MFKQPKSKKTRKRETLLPIANLFNLAEANVLRRGSTEYPNNGHVPLYCPPLRMSVSSKKRTYIGAEMAV